MDNYFTKALDRLTLAKNQQALQVIRHAKAKLDIDRSLNAIGIELLKNKPDIEVDKVIGILKSHSGISPSKKDKFQELYNVEFEKQAYSGSEEEILIAKLEDKQAYNTPLTAKELEYVNANFYLPDGFKYNNDWELIEVNSIMENAKRIAKDINRRLVSGLGSLSHEFDNSNYHELQAKYGAVYGAFDTQLIKAHKFFSKETDGFKNFDSLTGEIGKAWEKHLQAVNRIAKRVLKTGITPYSHSQRFFEGKQYKATQNLSTKEIADLVRQELLIEYPKPEYKFSVQTEVFSGGSSISVKIIDAPINPFSEIYQEAYKNDVSTSEVDRKYWEENNGRYPETYNEQAKKLKAKVTAIVQQYNFDNSDSQIDYFHVNFYKHVDFDDFAFRRKLYPNNSSVIKEIERNAVYDGKKQKRDEAAKAARERAGNFKKGDVVFYASETMHQSWHKYQVYPGVYLAVIAKSVNGRGWATRPEIFLLKERSDDAFKTEYKNAVAESGKGRKVKPSLNYFLLDNKYYSSVRQTLSAYPQQLIRYSSSGNTIQLAKAKAILIKMKLGRQ